MTKSIEDLKAEIMRAVAVNGQYLAPPPGSSLGNWQGID